MAEEGNLFLRIEGEERGPLTVGQVKELIDKREFTPEDFIRMEDKTHWVMAKNLVHLKALFDAKEDEQRKEAFSGWLDVVREGKPAMVLTPDGRVEERERIEQERQELEEARKKLEEEEARMKEELADEVAKRSEEYKRLVDERKHLEDERQRLEKEEEELSQMTTRVKRSRRIPIIIAGVVVLVTLAVGISLFINYLYKMEEYRIKLDQLDMLDAKIVALEEKLAKAVEDQDLSAISGISDELKELKEERDKLKEEIGETGETKVEPIEPDIETSLGTVNITGPLSIDGAGKNDTARTADKISSGVYGVMGSITSTYNKELGKTPGISGKVVVGFTISGGGSVTNAYVISSNVNNSRLESAIVSAIRGAHFSPTLAGDVTISYPFTFQPK